MNLTAFALENRTFTYFTMVMLVISGVAAFLSLGQLEDPEFTVKNAVITTSYPGASPEEVEQEVTDRIEKAIQMVEELDFVESESRAGLSIVRVHIQAKYWGDVLPQIWDSVRRKIRDMEGTLPPGAETPVINDDFGDVYGLLLAITSDGYSYGELEYYADILKREISLVDGVAKVDLWGEQAKRIYLELSRTQLDELGISMGSIIQTLEYQNAVVDAGHVDVQNRRMRFSPTGAFRSPEDIANLAIIADQTSSSGSGATRGDELIRIGDIATVAQGYEKPAQTIMRFNGQQAISLAISNSSGTNVVDMGMAVDQRLTELTAEIPIGIGIHKMHWQSDVVDESVQGFFINLGEAVLIVLVVLTLFMGWRMGVIIGSALILTILVTFVVMSLMQIDLQRMSLGALVIALGMMVDNAIVVAEGMLVRLQKGMNRTQAAIEAATQPAWPLLGATIVAVMAFFPIFSSTESAGEYCQTLFIVVAISLLASWVISITVTPLQCVDMIPDPKGQTGGELYGSGFYGVFQKILHAVIAGRWLTIFGMIGLLVLSGYGFTHVKQLFFPDSSMPKFMVEYWAPEGSRIEDVSGDLKRIEARLAEDDRVSAVAAFVGAGPPRFYLPVEPETQNAAYAQLVVNVKDPTTIRALETELNQWFRAEFAQAQVFVRVFGVGPSNTWKFEARFSGPSDADEGVLRALAQQGLDILDADPLVGTMETDWRQQVQTIRPVYNQERGRWAAITRENIADVTKAAYDGMTVGIYREGDDLIPIVVRNVEEERANLDGLDVLQVRSSTTGEAVPLSEVLERVDVVWEEAIIARRDRRRTITVQANPIPGVTLPTIMKNLKGQFEAIELPPGYSMEWGGELESSGDAQKSLAPGVIPAIAIMALIIVGLFNAMRPTLIIFLTVPFVLIGMTSGLLGANAAFGFMALLGAMSLSGMMIKNAIVLLDEININRAKGMDPYEAVVLSTMSRLRPVVLAAATTVLGVVPLIQDVFWIGMAVTIMGGLTFGTVITMILVPVLYATFFGLHRPKVA